MGGTRNGTIAARKRWGSVKEVEVTLCELLIHYARILRFFGPGIDSERLWHRNTDRLEIMFQRRR